VSTTRRSEGLTAGDPAAPPAGLTAGDPAVVPFAFAVTFARPGRYCFHCQHPASAGMADTFAVS
jgi:plastocyanin